MPREVNSASLLQSPIHLLHRAGQCAVDLFHAEMGDRDLTPRQLAVLMTVASDEGASQTKLVDATGIDRSTLADLVRRLQRKGLLQRRRRSDDARAYAVKLTDEGHRVLRAAEPLGKRVDERVLDALPKKQRQGFVDALASIVHALQDLSWDSGRRAKARS
jgi:DNA-binding MarR family transcriptional regulator